jgi:hypothetical protein
MKEPAKPGRGGPRPGAGRPKTNPTKPFNIRLNELQLAELKRRGGARAVKSWLDTPIQGNTE